MSANAYKVDWRDVFAGRVRSVEAHYASVHNNLMAWARWSRERFPGHPRISVSGIWSLPGETDPDRDTESIPEPVQPPIDEKAVLILDAKINELGFPSAWRRVLKSSYLKQMLEYQRPDDAHMGYDYFVDQLADVLEFLGPK